MDLFYSILALTLALFLFFFLARGVIRMYIDASLKKRARKRLAKDQSFLEWFFYKRYRDVIAKTQLVWYYSIMVLYALFLLGTIAFALAGITGRASALIEGYFTLNGIVLVGFLIAAPR